MKFQEKIKVLRLKAKMTQADMGKSLLVSRKTVSSWENGRNYPDINTFKELYTRGRALAEKRKVLIANVSKLKMEIEKIKVCPLCGQEINGDLNHVRF